MATEIDQPPSYTTLDIADLIVQQLSNIYYGLLSPFKKIRLSNVQRSKKRVYKQNICLGFQMFRFQNY